MNLKLRRAIFYSLIIIFFIFAFFIIPYSNGWHFDFSSFSFVKLGGLYIETNPTGTSIQIDKLNFQIKSGFIKSGLLIANLFPKTYYVSVTKDGYQPWTKNITIKPSLVTQVQPIVLLPKKWDKQLLAEDVKELYLGSSLIWKSNSDNLKLDNKIIKGTDFKNWLAGEKYILTYDNNNKTYFVINTLQNNTALNIGLTLDNLKEQKNILDANPIKEIIPHFSDKNKLLINTGQALYLLDFNKLSLDIIKTSTSSDGQYKLLKMNGNELFFADNNHLFAYNLDSKTEILLTKVNNITSLSVSADNKLVIFNDSKNLILLDRSNQELKKLSDNIVRFSLSPDNNKVAALTQSGQIKVFFIGNDYELFEKKQNAISELKIDFINADFPIVWHANSSYIFVKTQTDFRMIEINDAEPVNFHSVNILAEKYYYDPLNDVFYIINNRNLYKLISM